MIEGRKSELFYKYSCKGSPTVVFISGLGDGSDSWDGIQQEIAGIASTFAYDRAGTGKSPAVTIPCSCRDLVLELHEMLAELAVQPPYILVGHSFGGLIARLYAAYYPQDSSALVLVDAAAEYKEVAFEKILPEQLLPGNRAYLENPLLNSEKIDKRLSYRQIAEASLGEPGGIPISVITRGLPDRQGADWPAEEILEVEQLQQTGFLRLSTDGRQRFARSSGHYIHLNEPEIVIEEIRQMVELTSASYRE
ncbi:alpha/beta fold hydrolase [Paenibacillus pedocola]|uniref:alpha/beta fold hydrolase n=1 Tax=Paenibacillus pedocola TaxID=3242193 RepID=UPI002877ECAC|nr:alpha/beta hydrolase [Paenibacillus typhae]